MTDLSQWFEEHHTGLKPGGRFYTMQMALHIAKQIKKPKWPHDHLEVPVIVETGCTRQANDYGAGMSTVLFGQYAQKFGAKVYSVDISQRNVNVCKNMMQPYEQYYGIACMDSAEYLAQFPEKIDLLYLDSWDYPIIEIADKYGPREDFQENLQMLWDIGDEEFIHRHWPDIKDCQQHTVKELEAAWDKIHDGTIILIDDVNFPGGGKGRLAEKMLKERGYRQFAREHQSLWLHPDYIDLIPIIDDSAETYFGRLDGFKDVLVRGGIL